MNKNRTRASFHGSFLDHVEKLLQDKLSAADLSKHPTAKGDASERVWRKQLKCLLPSRYSVTSGFVVDAHGEESQQIDCIIYDRGFTPAFWGSNNLSYVLAEAVHAVFEIKNNAKSVDLKYASKKVESVRRLYRTSAHYKGSGKDHPPKELFHIIGGLLATKIGPGVGTSTFNKNINKYKGYGCIDMVLTAHNGYAHYFRTGFPTDQPPCTKTGTGSATKGLIVLIQALIAQGTVSAVDLDYYLNGRESV